jgi:hypothetical protein
MSNETKGRVVDGLDLGTIFGATAWAHWLSALPFPRQVAPSVQPRTETRPAGTPVIVLNEGIHNPPGFKKYN